MHQLIKETAEPVVGLEFIQVKKDLGTVNDVNHVNNVNMIQTQCGFGVNLSDAVISFLVWLGFYPSDTIIKHRQRCKLMFLARSS